MIASLEGVILQILDDSLVIGIGGLGIQVMTSQMSIKKAEIHKRIGLFTYLVVREESLTLYGFENMEERKMFVLLLGVNGVGPRTAMAIISTLSVDTIKKAVLNEQPDLFSGVSGVGKKSSQAIVLHLQGKIPGFQGEVHSKTSDMDADVIAALTNLGYSIVEAQSAVQMLPKDTPEDLEVRVRLALNYFS
jgi:Holliday junction DNA helicase RuvA